MIVLHVWAFSQIFKVWPELRCEGAEDAVVVLHVWVDITGVLKHLIQEVQVLLYLWDMLPLVLLGYGTSSDICTVCNHNRTFWW